MDEPRPEPDASSGPPPGGAKLDPTRAALVAVGVLAAAVIVWWAANPGEPDGPGPAEPVPSTPREPLVGEPVVLVAVPTLVDRFVREPCSRVAGAGLYSLDALLDATRAATAGVPVLMGDLTTAEGEVAERTVEHLLTDILPRVRYAALGAGEAELGLGVEFARNVLGRTLGGKVLCANAVDSAKRPLLKGWVLLNTDDRGGTLLVAAVAADSLAAELVRRGSDVGLTPAGAAAAAALAEGTEQGEALDRPIGTAVLLVHGTVEEAEAILAAAPGYDVAVAAHGPVLPLQEPHDAAGVPVYYGGQGMRFVWQVLVGPELPPGPHAGLSRIGGEIGEKGSPYADALAKFRARMRDEIFPDVVARATRPKDLAGGYAHADACAGCHQDVWEQHRASPHAKSSKEILGEEFAASTQCLPCHVTGPYRVDGWAGPADESDFAGISCEACHGPGAEHVASQDATYGAVSLDACYGCHLPDRSPGFDAEAAWRAWGHGAPK